jgi:hypothetical protein
VQVGGAGATIISIKENTTTKDKKTFFILKIKLLWMECSHVDRKQKLKIYYLSSILT